MYPHAKSGALVPALRRQKQQDFLSSGVPRLSWAPQQDSASKSPHLLIILKSAGRKKRFEPRLVHDGLCDPRCIPSLCFLISKSKLEESCLHSVQQWCWQCLDLGASQAGGKQSPRQALALASCCQATTYDSF